MVDLDDRKGMIYVSYVSVGEIKPEILLLTAWDDFSYSFSFFFCMCACVHV